MTQVSFGPVNITSGNSAKFVVEFLDSNGNITTPASANLIVDYTNTSNVAQTDTVSLSVTGSFFTGTWSSTSASRGLASWTLTGAGSTVTAQAGLIRVIYPGG
jgi:hypothetical protein